MAIAGIGFSSRDYYPSGVASNASGDARLWLFPGSNHSLQVSPSVGNYLPTTTGLNVVDDMSVVVSLQTPKADQTITFGPITDRTYGDAPFDVSATASSGLEVSFTASGDCTVSGTTVTITGAGSCTITAHQPGDANWNPAPDVSQTFSIGMADQTITFGPITDRTYGDAPFDVSATASSGLEVSFTARAANGPPRVISEPVGLARLLGAGPSASAGA